MSRAHYDRELFYPLEGKPKRRRFATLDLESKDGASEKAGFTRPFLAGLYDGSRYQAFVDTNPGGDVMTRFFRAGGCVDRLMHACMHHKRFGTTYYCHNGGGFDFLFLLPWLMRNLDDRKLSMELIPVGGSRLLSIDIRVRGQKWGGWRFVDSLRTLPMALDKAGEAFGVGRKNMAQLLDANGKPFELDTPSSDPAWIPYNQNDCVLLYDVLEVAHDIVENEFGGEMGLTAPSTAMKTFRRAFLPAPIRRDTDTHAFVREGYFGGRTEWLLTEAHHQSYFDVNSSYPHAMTQPMPMGDAQVWGEGEPPRQWQENRVGFCRVTVRVPDDIALPPLPVKADGAFFPKDSGLDGKLIFPTGTLVGVWEWDELKNAVEHGCEILEWHESVWYAGGPLLAEFVDRLYRYRDKGKCFRCSGAIGGDYYCKACEEPGYLVGLDAWAKLLLNSLYGKTGQRPERTAYHLAGDDLPDGAQSLIPEDPNCPIWLSETEVDSPFIMPQIAARVTAIARVTLYRAAMTAIKSVIRECWRCHSKVTYRGTKTGSGWVLGSRIGGSGSHGDELAVVAGYAIGPAGSVCPCGGHVETRNGRVSYMDTDSIVTDAQLPTGKALGALKDEVPRFSGFVHGRFYASKMYHLSVEPSWLDIDLPVRRAMLMRDSGFLKTLGLETPPRTVDEAAASSKTSEWWSVRAKGLTRKQRTPGNLRTLYEGAMARLEWSAKPENRYADGTLKRLPDELEQAGTVMDRRLEQFGTLMNLIERDENGEAILHVEADGLEHVTSTPFQRGPLMVDVPRRLHLEGAKRQVLQDGTTRPYRVDMTQKRPAWWTDREERRAKLRAARESRASTARAGRKGYGR